jgi:hypothetical protein
MFSPSNHQGAVALCVSLGEVKLDGVEAFLWDWAAMGRMFVSAGAATACVQLLYPFIRDRRHSRRHAAYMAMRMAVALEAYSEGCAGLIQTISRDVRRNQGPPGLTIALPTPPHYPEDLDGWKAIDHTLADRCLSFESRTRQSQAIRLHYRRQSPAHRSDGDPGGRSGIRSLGLGG